MRPVATIYIEAQNDPVVGVVTLPGVICGKFGLAHSAFIKGFASDVSHSMSI
jgi:hypothetical protein